jgi:GGDEF domain-containing protein
LPVPVTATYFPLPSQPGEPRVDALILAELPTRPAPAPGARPGSDPATGLLSRERFEALYARERERAQRYQSGLGVVRVAVRPRLVASARDSGPPPVAPADLEAALLAVADLLQRALRTVDVVGRCDDHDCAVVLPAANFAGVRSVVDRLEVGLRELMATGDVPPLVDVTLGVALSEGYEDLLARCSQRLHSLTEPE